MVKFGPAAAAAADIGGGGAPAKPVVVVSGVVFVVVVTLNYKLNFLFCFKGLFNLGVEICFAC